MVSILFVCLGNICRSPAAEGMLRHLLNKENLGTMVNTESCGLGDWHTGSFPDERMCEASKKRGIILTSRAQIFLTSFFEKFDFILAADQKVLAELHRYAKTPDHKSKLHFMTHFSKCYKNEEIPDPYYAGEAGFELVLDMLEDSCEGLVDHLKKI